MDNEEMLEQSSDQAEGLSDQVGDQAEPLIIETKGKWQPFEAMTGQELEVGKTYHIHIDGVCEFSLSEGVPQAGIQTNDINYTKNDKIKLWIRTGEKING